MHVNAQALRGRGDVRVLGLHGQEQGLAVAGPQAPAALLRQRLARAHVARGSHKHTEGTSSERPYRGYCCTFTKLV